jgi:hypothetical protein
VTEHEVDGLGALTGNDARELDVVLLDAAERFDRHRCHVLRYAAELRGARPPTTPATTTRRASWPPHAWPPR